MPKKTLVIGASPDPARYSYLAIAMLRQYGHPVLAIGKRGGRVSDIDIHSEMPKEAGIDTVTLYLNPVLQKAYYEYIINLHPKRIIFNPGTENPEFSQLAKKAGIEVMEACTLVLLRTGQY